MKIITAIILSITAIILIITGIAIRIKYSYVGSMCACPSTYENIMSMLPLILWLISVIIIFKMLSSIIDFGIQK